MNDTVQVMDVLQFGWTRFKEETNNILMLGFAVFMILILANGLLAFSAHTPLYFLLSIAYRVLMLGLSMGLTLLFLNFHDQNPFDITLLYSYWKPFWKYLGLSIILGILIFIGFLFLIVPGVYMCLRYCLAPFLLLDTDCSIKEAIQKSAVLTEGHKMDILLFGILAFIINFIGAIPFGLGLFVTLPITTLAFTKIYRTLSHPSKAQELL